MTLNLMMWAGLLAHAEMPRLEKIWEREVIAAKCSQEEGLDKLPPAEALRQLESIHWLAPEELEVIKAALADDFGNSFLKWVVVAHSDCAAQRLKYSRAVMAGPSGLASRLLATLVQTKAPTLLNLMIDLLIFQEALQKGFFNTAAGLLDDVVRFRAEMKQASRELEPEGKIFADEHVGETAPTADAMARFKASKNLPRMQAAANKEWELSEKSFVRLRELLDRAK